MASDGQTLYQRQLVNYAIQIQIQIQLYRHIDIQIQVSPRQYVYRPIHVSIDAKTYFFLCPNVECSVKTSDVVLPRRENERLSLITGCFHGSLIPSGSALMMSYYFLAKTHCREMINNITCIAKQQVNFSYVYSQKGTHADICGHVSLRLTHSSQPFLHRVNKGREKEDGQTLRDSLRQSMQVVPQMLSGEGMF